MSEFLYDFPEVIDNTMRTAWDSCEHKFLMEHVHHFRHKKPSEHLVFGGSYAKGLEVMRLEFYKGEQNKVIYAGKAMLEVIREWDRNCDDPLLDYNKNLPNCLCALLYYLETWPLHTDWIKPYGWKDHTDSVEFTFAIPLEIKHPVTGNPILYAGRFDLLADYASQPAVYDDKTTTQLGPSWIKQWGMNSQMTGYIWAARQHGYDTSTAIIRGVSILKRGFGHSQAIEHRQNWEIERWYNTMHKNLEDMIKAWERRAFSYSLGSSCGNYGGCPFAEMCRHENWQQWIKTDFKIYKWNPLEILPD